MSRFEYPKLSRTEIVTILIATEIAAVTETDLKNPKQDFISDLYSRLLIRIGALDEEDQGQIEFSALEKLENPDLHAGSIPVINLYNRIKKVLAMLECPTQFNLRDLIIPDAVRTETFLSALLNFCLHKDEKMKNMKPIVDELSELYEQRSLWEDKISQLNAAIAGYNETREKDLPLVQEMDAKVKELRQTIAGLNNHQMSLRTSLRKLKDKTGEMDEKISRAEFELVQSAQENEVLRSRIVQSPDKLQRALEEKKLAREEARNAERSAMQSFREKTSILEVYTKSFKKMSKHLGQMQAIQEQVDSAKAVEKEYRDLNAKLSDDAVLDKSLEARLAERKGKAELLEELRKQLEKERDLKIAESTKELNSVRLEVESQRRHLEARQRQVEQVVEEVETITKETNLVKESAAAKVQKLASKSEEIVKEFETYKSSIEGLLPTDGQEIQHG